MAIQTRSFLILGFLVAAVICYMAGYATGLVTVLVIGGIFGLLFWAKLFKRLR